VNGEATREEGANEDVGLAVELAPTSKGGRSRRRSEARQRTEFVGLRLLPGELEALQAAAQDRNVSLSELIRSSALKEAKG
jgi:hypothetical protein